MADPSDRPTPTVTAEIEAKFIRLRDEWRAQRAHESSTSRMVLLPAYQTIIGMGKDVIPLLLRELERRVENWFWALQAITEANPVPAEARGSGEKMAAAWLAWGRSQGYEW